MAFIYDDSLTTDRDYIRFKISDTQESAGPRPDKRNFSDAEIAAVLSDESTTTATIAALFETLAAEWQPFSLSEKNDEIWMDAKKLYEGYLEQAAIWRNKPGGSSTAQRSGGLIAITREDAWTDTGGEYSS